MAVFVSYSDEAAIADVGGEFLVAGYMGDEKEWPYFKRAWQERVLDGPPAIPSLHMTKIRSRAWRGEYSISGFRAEDRVTEAVRVLYSTGALSAVSSKVRRADIQEVIHQTYDRKRWIPKGLDEPDYMCYLGYVVGTLMRVHWYHREVHVVNFVVSRKDQVTKVLRESIEDTRRFFNNRHPEIAPLLGEFEFASMEDEIPLQAADVLCWHLQRYYSGSFDRTEESRMWYLFKERNGSIHDWSRENIETMATNLGIR